MLPCPMPITLQTVPFRIKLSEVPYDKRVYYWVEAHTPDVQTPVLARLYKLHAVAWASHSDCLVVEILNFNKSSSGKPFAGHSIMSRPGSTVVSIHPSVCTEAKCLTSSNGRGDEIPIRALQHNSFRCGHLIMSVRTQFNVLDRRGYVANRDETEVTARAEQALGGRDEIKSPAPWDCPVCSFVWDLPEPPKNAPDTFMDLFDNDPFTRDDFANFGIRALDSEYSVHPVVVGKASPVLRGMITNKDTQEAQQGYTTVHNAEPQHVRLLLEAIYDGSLIDHWEKTFDLLSPIYALADFYGVSKVMAACKAAFRFVPVNAWNLCEILAFADLYELWELVRRCCDCEVQNGLPRDFWQVGPGKQFKVDRASAFKKYADLHKDIKHACKCGPPLDLD